MAANERTISGRETAFPMKDAYGPVVKAGIPVPGLTRFPGRYNVLGRHYYGLDTDETPENQTTAQPGTVVAFNAEPVSVAGGIGADEAVGFAGFGDAADGWPSFPGNTGSQLPGGSGGGGGGGGIDWGAIINAGIHAAPAIIQASEGGGAPYNFYQQGIGVNQTQYGQQQIQYINGVPYTRNAYGQLIPLSSAGQLGGQLGIGVATIGNSLTNFVTQNPLLVLGGGLALLLLFMRPPGRR